MQQSYRAHSASRYQQTPYALNIWWKRGKENHIISTVKELTQKKKSPYILLSRCPARAKLILYTNNVTTASNFRMQKLGTFNLQQPPRQFTSRCPSSQQLQKKLLRPFNQPIPCRINQSVQSQQMRELICHSHQTFSTPRNSVLANQLAGE